MEQLKVKRQAELLEKEKKEEEELAKRQVHRPGQKLDINNFGRAYAEKMEALRQKKLAKQEILAKEQQEGQTFAPVLNKYSLKIAEAGGIANVKKERIAQGKQPVGGNTTFSDTTAIISAAVANG